MTDFVNPARMLALEQALQDLRDEFREAATTERIWEVAVGNPLLVNGPTCAPTSTTASGSVTENRDYAFTAISNEGNRETILSGSVSVVLASAQAILKAARMVARDVDALGVYTRLTGGTSLDWRQVAEIANPASGTWTYTDNHTYGYYLGNDPPLSFVVPLQTVCGQGYRLRRVKIQPEWDYAQSASAYWNIGLAVKKPEATKARWTITQDTQKVGLQAARLYNLPMFHDGGEVPNRDLDLSLFEDERVYLTLRGVGAVGPLPPLKAMVNVTREVG